MSIDSGTDKLGHSMRLLVWQGLKLYPVERMWQFLNDKDSVVRTLAAQRIQMNADEMSLTRTLELTKAKRWRLREIGAFILGQLGTPDLPFKTKSIPILETMCSDSSSEVRTTALSALGHLQAHESRAIISAALDDPVPTVREMAQFVLEDMLA